MPEGDSYTRAADRIRPVLVGHFIEAVDGSAGQVRRRARRLVGARILDVRTHGKHLLIDTDSGLSVHVHLGMPGRVRVSRPGGTPGQEPGAVRLRLTTDAGTVWVLAAPTVEVDRRAAIDHRLRRLGPDLLSEDFDRDAAATRAAAYPPEATVSDFLLDQRVGAGIGNEYKCEALFLEGISPLRLVADTDVDTRMALLDRARRIMLPNAHRSERTTTGRRDVTRWVFERTGRPCRRCRTAVTSRWVGDPPRITYWCPHCQT